MPFCISWLQSSGTPAAAAAADLELQLPGPKPPEPKPPDTKLLYCSLLLGVRCQDQHRPEPGRVTLSCSACSTCKGSSMRKSVAACKGSGSMQGTSCSSMHMQQHTNTKAAACKSSSRGSSMSSMHVTTAAPVVAETPASAAACKCSSSRRQQQQCAKASAHAVATLHAKAAACKDSSMQKQQQQKNAKTVQCVMLVITPLSYYSACAPCIAMHTYALAQQPQ